MRGRNNQKGPEVSKHIELKSGEMRKTQDVSGIKVARSESGGTMVRVPYFEVYGESTKGF